MKHLLKLLVCVAILFTLTFTGFDSASGQVKRSKISKNYKTSKKSRTKRSKHKEIPEKENYNSPSKEDEEEFEEDHEKREEWFMMQRTFPFDSIPNEARRKAFNERPADADFGDSQFAAPQWKAIGPQPTSSYFPNNWGLTSGRINSIAVSPANPNIVLVGAAVGGVWRSTDGGANFTTVTDGQVDIAVGSISFSASNPNIVYAGMGDKDSNYFGSGVLRSTDAGLTWTRVNNSSLPAPGRISQVLVDPNNSNRVYVAQYSVLNGASTFSSGFFYSLDGGVNWTKTFSGLPKDLVQHPTQTNTLYLSSTRDDNNTGSSAGGVYKSTNNGVTWTRLYSSPFSGTSNAKIAVTPIAPSNLYVLIGSGSTARVEISTDEGANWTNKGSNFDTGQFSYNCYIFVHPTNANTIYVGTRDLWRSTDGGTNYTNITNNFTLTGGYTPNSARAHPDQHHFYISNSDPNTIYISGDGGLWKSTNGASTFQSLNATLALTMFVSLDLHPTDATKSYGGTQDNGTQKRNGNQSWREFATGDGGQTIIDPLDPSIVYTTYVYNTVYRYNNNGDSFGGTIGSNTVFNNDRVAFYPPFEANETNGNLFFGTYRLYMSSTRGASWTQLAGGADLTYGSDVLSTIGTSKANPNYIYTGSSSGRVMVSTDGGATFTDRTAGLPQRFIKSIKVSPTNPATAYLTVSGYLTSHVFKTVNAGASWTDISGNLPDIPVNDLLIDPNANTLYIGTDIGVFRSTVGGNTWQTFNMNFPPTVVTELDAQSSGLLQAATYGRGMFEINVNQGSRAVADFDGDGKTDISVFRPSDGGWYITNSSNNGFNAAQFGQNGDVITPGDYDNDGKADFAVFRNGNWYVLRSSDNSFYGVSFGFGSDKPVAADYDGDGKTDIAVFRSGAWYVLQSSNSQLKAGSWGFGTDLTVPSDYDGDGKADFAVFRPSNGTWYVLKSSDNGLIASAFGQSGDKPVIGDYDADGKADFAIYRNGTWYVQQSTAGFRGIAFGASTDIPAQGDFDGDGKTDFGVFRPSNGTWYISLNANNAFVASAFGANGDVPVPSGY